MQRAHPMHVIYSIMRPTDTNTPSPRHALHAYERERCLSHTMYTIYTVRSRQPHSTVGEGNCRCHDSCHYTSHLAPQLPRQMQHFPPKVSHQPAAIAHTSGQSRCGTVSHADGKRECNGVCELERKPLSPKCRCTIYGPMSDSDTDIEPSLLSLQ